jgi:hypothetical protein
VVPLWDIGVTYLGMNILWTGGVYVTLGSESAWDAFGMGVRGRENGDYSIFLGRLAVTEQSGRDTDTDRGFDVLGLRLIGLVIGEGRSMEDCSR